jgi:putative DNA-invertase from lambdoid prophage Rac
MIASVMAALAEFERYLFRERIKSDIAAAKARGKRLGRQPGQRSSDRKATKVRPKIVPISQFHGLSSVNVPDVVHSEHFRAVTPN